MRNDSWVYVVDDDLSMREALTALARAHGWRVKAFGSAAEFLEHPRLRVPSVLILDMHMPGLSGLDLQRQLDRTQDDIPIVYLSGSSDVPTAVRAMKGGAVEFLTKPFDNESLIRAIEQNLSRWPLRSRTSQGTGATVLEFEGFRLDMAEQCLWQCAVTPARRIVLKPKAFLLLRYLVERAGRLVSEEELLQAAWPQVCVQPEAVKGQLYEIRKILGDNPRTPRFIETLNRRGYRFIAPVSSPANVEPPPGAGAAAGGTAAAGATVLGDRGLAGAAAGGRIPERIAHAIEALWTEALAKARESLAHEETDGSRAPNG